MSNKKKVEVVVEEYLLSNKQKKSVILAAGQLCSFMDSKSKKFGENILKQIWPGLPSFNWDFKPVLELQPLDRVGGEPGKSGISVLAGHFSFRARGKKSTIPSRQMIIKTSPDPGEDPEFASEKRKELVDEWDAVRKVKQKFKDRKHFARPLWLYDIDKNMPAVLWAPFESPDSAYILSAIGQRWQFVSVLEMVKYLSAAWASTKFQKDKNTRKERLRGITDAVNSLIEAHNANGEGYRKPTNLVKHYDWELREFLNDKKGWAQKWYELWKTDDSVLDFGKKWPNPITVCHKLSKLGNLSLRMGYVHGDLHPRNIVFASDNTIRIIDFGWARPSKKDPELQHIVKDFVLLEANLRFMTLPPFLPYDSVKRFLDWINSKRTPRKNIHDECRLRIDLIKELRETAKKHVGKFKNWDIEYIAPLFLVSLGLLKHCHSADCTWAARYNVLTLARYLVKNNIV